MSNAPSISLTEDEAVLVPQTVELALNYQHTRYQERNTRYGKQQGVVMPGGFWVQKRTLEATWNQVHKNWSSIDWSSKQCAETMIGTAYWKQTPPGGARLAMGRCIRYFIANGMLPRPLEVANPGKKGKRFYRPC